MIELSEQIKKLVAEFVLSEDVAKMELTSALELYFTKAAKLGYDLHKKQTKIARKKFKPTMFTN